MATTVVPHEGATGSKGRTKVENYIVLGVLVALLAGATIFIYQAIPKNPGENSAEAGFLRDMITHHIQAVEMAMIIQRRTADPALKSMATDMVLTQSSQVGMMQGWLNVWGLDATGNQPAMAWMGDPVPAGQLMPGMATPAQVASLKTLPVPQAEILFLQLMIRHHQGGVNMAEAVLQRSDQTQIRQLANTIVSGQQAEITAMNGMLKQRGQPEITAPLPMNMSGH